MANENKPNSNTSQFFLTLDACEHLKVRFFCSLVGVKGSGRVWGGCRRALRAVCHRRAPMIHPATPKSQGKHTIFGKVTGDTIFNLLRMGEAPTDLQDRPLEPIKLEWVEVLANPFDDIVPR